MVGWRNSTQRCLVIQYYKSRVDGASNSRSLYPFTLFIFKWYSFGNIATLIQTNVGTCLISWLRMVPDEIQYLAEYFKLLLAVICNVGNSRLVTSLYDMTACRSGNIVSSRCLSLFFFMLYLYIKILNTSKNFFTNISCTIKFLQIAVPIFLINFGYIFAWKIEMTVTYH